MPRENYETKFFIRDFFIEGQLACDTSQGYVVLLYYGGLNQVLSQPTTGFDFSKQAWQ
jgi:hypothetical protein